MHAVLGVYWMYVPVLTLTFDLPMLPVDIILRFYMTRYIFPVLPTVDQILALKLAIWGID